MKFALQFAKMATNSEFVVEEVLDARLNTRGKFEYFIKWKGFQNDESTWEPEENVQGCDAVL
jgi:chromodomain protein Y